MAKTPRTPSEVRNMLEVRVRKLGQSYEINKQISVIDEMVKILRDFRTNRVELLHKRQEKQNPGS